MSYKKDDGKTDNKEIDCHNRELPTESPAKTIDNLLTKRKITSISDVIACYMLLLSCKIIFYVVCPWIFCCLFGALDAAFDLPTIGKIMFFAIFGVIALFAGIYLLQKRKCGVVLSHISCLFWIIRGLNAIWSNIQILQQLDPHQLKYSVPWLFVIVLNIVIMIYIQTRYKHFH